MSEKEKITVRKHSTSGQTTVYSEEERKKILETSNKKARKSSDDAKEKIFVENLSQRPMIPAIVFGIIKCLIAFIAVIGFFCVGLVLGIAKAYIDTTPSLDVSTLTNSELTSYIYDCNGNEITTYANMEYRDWASIEEIPDMLKNALIAVEDVRFYTHGGLDFKRLFSAVVNTLRNTNTHGGSTITQQLIKNRVLSNVQSYKRKIQEAYLAYELEDTISKDQILEAYMNDVYLGDSNYGFKTAAKDYFGKDMDELTIRECAMLAGMVQKPNYTNPRANTYRRFYDDGTNKMDITDARTDVVLKAMYEAGFITKAEYNHALNDDVEILEVSAQKQLYDMAYYVEYGIRDIVDHMLEQRGLDDTSSNRSAIERELRTSGYKIYLAVDPEIQNTVQDIITNWEDYPALRNSSAGLVTDPVSGITIQQPQAAAVVIDHSTGLIKAIIGGRDEPTQKRQLNRAYQSSMPVGSSIKPLTVYGPALDMGISPGTGVLNSEIPIEGYGGEKGYPAMGSEKWEGIVSVRRGITSSLNIVAAKLLFEVSTPEQSAEYLIKLGVPAERINKDGPGLALGTSGITPLEMAAAYACIANGGVYIEPISFIKVVASDGTVILDANDCQQSYRVYKESTAYMLVDMMEDVVTSGTGKSAQIAGITVAGKTGTNDDYTSAYFAGFTGYYTASLWIGHDKYSEKLASGSTGGNTAAPLWQAFMSAIHEGLSDKPIIDASPADFGLTQVDICPISGKLATDACWLDENNPPLTDWCVVDNIPDEYCDMHCCVDFCEDSDMLACVECPTYSRVPGSVVLISSTSVYAQLADEKLYAYIPNAIRTELDICSFITQYLQLTDKACSIHSAENPFSSAEELYYHAGKMIAEVRAYLDNVSNLPDESRQLLENAISELQTALAQNDENQVAALLTKLKRYYNELYHQYPPNLVPNS